MQVRALPAEAQSPCQPSNSYDPLLGSRVGLAVSVTVTAPEPVASQVPGHVILRPRALTAPALFASAGNLSRSCPLKTFGG